LRSLRVVKELPQRRRQKGSPLSLYLSRKHFSMWWFFGTSTITLGYLPWNKRLGNTVVDYCQRGPETRTEFGFGSPQITCIVVNMAFHTHCLVTTTRILHCVH